MTQADRADVFRGLAHPLRREVLIHLKRQERTVGELLDLVGASVAMPTLSEHLRVLRDSGLVRQSKAGHHRVYRIHRPAQQRALRWLNQIS
jgi:DNA-binding transcriptional ArsR family regulator